MRKLRAANVASVLQQVANNDFDEPTFHRLQRFAHEHQMTVEQVRLALAATPAFARFFAGDPTKQYTHERLSFEYMVALALHPDTAIDAAYRIPQKGANTLVITADGVCHGDDVGRRKQRGRPIDTNAFVAGWSVYQFHKYTFEEGGAQRNAFADVETWVEAARRFGTETGPLHRSMDPFELERPALYVAVVDGPFWNADARAHIAKAGKAVATPTPGAVMVCSTAELNDLYDAIAATAA